MASSVGLGAAGECSFGSSASCLTVSMHYYRTGSPASPLLAPPCHEDGVRMGDRDGFSLLVCVRRVGSLGSEPRDGFSGLGFSPVVAAVCSMLLLDLPGFFPVARRSVPVNVPFIDGDIDASCAEVL